MCLSKHNDRGGTRYGHRPRYWVSGLHCNRILDQACSVTSVLFKAFQKEKKKGAWPGAVSLRARQ